MKKNNKRVSNSKRTYKYDNRNQNHSKKVKYRENIVNSKKYDVIDLGELRLNKYISSSGLCSRREADEYINQGKVKVNGKVAGIGSKINDSCEVSVNNQLIVPKKNTVYICLNKPLGITSTTELDVKGNIIDHVNYPERIFPIGRLDKESEGLILLTNNGDIVNKILRAGNKHEKEYIVRVNKVITDDFIKKMGEGVPILGTVTKHCKIEKIDEFTFNIILVQGLNRQIRRMCEYFNYEVLALKRIRIMNIKLDKLPVGDWRFLTEDEMTNLRKLSGDSSKIA